MVRQPIPANEVHVWSSELQLEGWVVNVLQQSLSPDERIRAGRFAFQQDRRNFVASRGILRDALARYLDCSPRDIRFDREPNGKPRLSFAEAQLSLEFNLSHTSGFLVLAVANGRRVGIDVERVRSLPDLDLVAARSFSAYERKVLSTLNGREKIEAFFRCWTRKEAYLKGLGEGLSIPLDSFDMPLGPGNSIHMLANRFDPQEATRWSFYSFVPKEGFVGALAIEGQAAQLVFKQWKAAEA